MIFPAGYIPFSDALALWAARMELLDSTEDEEERPRLLPIRDFLDDLEEDIPAYVVGIDGACLRIMNQVFESFHHSDLEASFSEFEQLSGSIWKLIQDDELDNAPELVDLSDFFRIPKLGEYYFLHFSPLLRLRTH